MLTQLHVLLSYSCNYECDHCFLYCSSEAKGTFTLSQIDELILEAKKIGTIEWFYFEGGEPFLFFPLLVDSIRKAKTHGFKVGVVTNGYWATSEENAEYYLTLLENEDVDELMVSNDYYHYGDDLKNFAKIAVDTGKTSSCVVFPSTIEQPSISEERKSEYEKAMPIVDSDVMFRGRAADKLTQGLPTQNWINFKECPYEDLVSPTRVHLDSYGNIHICQGIIIGNFWNTPLSKIMKNYDPIDHRICNPLHHGGPAELIQRLNIAVDKEFVDECHACFEARRMIIDKYKTLLAPRQVYGLH